MSTFWMTLISANHPNCEAHVGSSTQHSIHQTRLPTALAIPPASFPIYVQFILPLVRPQESLDTGEGVRANLLLEGKLGKSIERADSALALLPPQLRFLPQMILPTH